jgi:hypothetical protein
MSSDSIGRYKFNYMYHTIVGSTTSNTSMSFQVYSCNFFIIIATIIWKISTSYDPQAYNVVFTILITDIYHAD